jgi:hypothetical protein
LTALRSLRSSFSTNAKRSPEPKTTAQGGAARQVMVAHRTLIKRRGVTGCRRAVYAVGSGPVLALVRMLVFALVAALGVASGAHAFAPKPVLRAFSLSSESASGERACNAAEHVGKIGLSARFPRRSIPFNRFRYYDPEAGQYASQDPIGLAGGLGLHAYVHDPLTWVDPFGLSETCGARGVRRPSYVPKGSDGAPSPLPRGPNGELAPSSMDPHTQIGWQEGRRGGYVQTREFGPNGQPVKQVDWTNHGRPGQHTDPHVHDYVPNPTGGSPQHGPARPPSPGEL